MSYYGHTDKNHELAIKYHEKEVKAKDPVNKRYYFLCYLRHCSYMGNSSDALNQYKGKTNKELYNLATKQVKG